MAQAIQGARKMLGKFFAVARKSTFTIKDFAPRPLCHNPRRGVFCESVPFAHMCDRFIGQIKKTRCSVLDLKVRERRHIPQERARMQPERETTMSCMPFSVRRGRKIVRLAGADSDDPAVTFASLFRLAQPAPKAIVYRNNCGVPGVDLWRTLPTRSSNMTVAGPTRSTGFFPRPIRPMPMRLLPQQPLPKSRRCPAIQKP